MSYHRFQIYFFITFLTLSLLLTLAVFQSYFVMLAFGGVIAVVAKPIHQRLLNIFRNEGLAAFLTVLVIAIIVILPLAYLSTALVSEVIDVVGAAKSGIDSQSLSATLSHWLPVSAHNQIPAIVTGAKNILTSFVSNLTSGVLGFFSGLSRVAFAGLVIMFAAYYLLKDGDRLKKEILTLSPMGDEYDELVIDRVATAVRAVMGGVLVIALIKSLVAGLAFWALGVPAPSFWGAMTGFAALIPILGSALVTVPVAVYLFSIGHFVSGTILVVLSVFVIGLVDNFLQPKLVQSKTNIHPLLILLSILGGLQLYGFSGFILGPLTLVISVVLIDIFKKEFKSYLETAN